MCEIISLPIESINYRFLYFRANDKNRPLFEVWSSSPEELYNLCRWLSKLKKPNNNYHYAEATHANLKKIFLPAPIPTEKQKDNNYHIYIEL